jgi:uncharacterized membrane protein
LLTILSIRYRLSVEDHLTLFAHIRGIHHIDVQRTVDDLIEQLELQPHRKKLSMRLSGGMKRKLCVAIALVGDPKVGKRCYWCISWCWLVLMLVLIVVVLVCGLCMFGSTKRKLCVAITLVGDPKVGKRCYWCISWCWLVLMLVLIVVVLVCGLCMFGSTKRKLCVAITLVGDPKVADTS